MAKQQKKTSSSKPAEMGFSIGKLIPEKYKTPAAILVILILIAIFFAPILFGDKTTQSGDLIQAKSLREYATKERDTFALWNPYIFCGIPAVVTSASIRWFDLTSAAYSLTTIVTSSITKDINATFILSFFLLGFTTFFFMRDLGFNRGASLFTALALAFSTGIMILFFIGHITKLKSLAVFPFILMMLFRFQKQIKLMDILLLVLGLHLLVLSAHVQIVYYFMLVAVIFFAYYFTRSFITKDKFLQKQLLKSIVVFAGASVIAILMSYDTYSQILEYKPYSTRGTQSVTETQKTDGVQNNSYEYATNWSFSPGEIMTFIIPSYYGFGRSTYNGELSRNEPIEVNTYFGQMPFVDSAMYMGIIIFALGLFALIVRRKEPIIQFFGIVIVLFILISFGKNFPLIYNLLYYNLPMFDNFRAPSMILHVVQIIFPILAGFGVMSIISLRKERNIKIENALKYSAIALAVIFVLSLLMNDSLTSWFSQRVSNYTETLGQSRQAQTYTALTPYMGEMFTNDVTIALGLLTIMFGLSYAYSISKINRDLLLAGLIVLALFDLFRIGNRGASYVDAEMENEQLKEPEYISVINAQNDKAPYRLLNMKQRDNSLGSISNNGNFNVYFLKEDLYGYSAAKPRSYQDIVDVVSPANFTLWRMLGVKYIITDKPFPFEYFMEISVSQDSITFVNRNDKALSRIYFVDNVEEKSSVEILNAMKNNSFDPKKLAFVDKLDFKFDKGDSTNTADITQYKDESVIAKTISSGNNFLFFSTTYLPNWKALVDGVETQTYKTNHGFIGIVVPKGNHNVEFLYQSKGFTIGKYLSLILNIILFTGIIGLYIVKKKKPNNKE